MAAGDDPGGDEFRGGLVLFSEIYDLVVFLGIFLFSSFFPFSFFPFLFASFSPTLLSGLNFENGKSSTPEV